MARQIKTKRFLLFGGIDTERRGWDSFICDSNYHFALHAYVPREFKWFQIVDLESKEIIVNYIEEENCGIEQSGSSSVS